MGLCLSRMVGESIEIGPEVTVTVKRIANGKVRLGFDAPDHVLIARSELSGFERDVRQVIDVEQLIEGSRQAGVVSQLALQLACVAANVDDEFRSLLDTVVARLDSVDVEQFTEVS